MVTIKLQHYRGCYRGEHLVEAVGPSSQDTEAIPRTMGEMW